MAAFQDNLKTRSVALATVLGAMWLIYMIDAIIPGRGAVLGHGIIPRTFAGITGIPAAPWIHASIRHLAANTMPFLVLGALVLLRGIFNFVVVVFVSTIVAGVGTWLFGAGGAQHIGASGVVFGLFGYLVFRAAFDKRLSSAISTLIVAVAYGTAMARSLIPADDISWSGHFFGFVGGFVAARIRHSAMKTEPMNTALQSRDRPG